MLRSQTLLPIALLLAVPIFVLTGACSASSEDDLSQTEDELRALKPNEVAGTIAYGETVGPLPYTNGPRYRALKFTGEQGDAIDVWVRSSDGDARAWLVSGTFKTLASNDDASSSETNAHLVRMLGKSGTHYIVWREKNLEDASFTVSLSATTSTDAGAGEGGTAPTSAFKAAAGAYTLSGACETTGSGTAPSTETAVVSVFTQPDGTQPSLRIETISGEGIYRPLPIDTGTLPVDGGVVTNWAYSEVGGLVSKSGSVTFQKTSSSSTYALVLVGTHAINPGAPSVRRCTFGINAPFAGATPEPEELPEGIVTAVGSCQGSEVYPYACVSGTPGRNSNGCCTAVSPYGGAADLQFKVSAAAGGGRELHVIKAPAFTPGVQGMTVPETGTATFNASPSLSASFVQGAFVIKTSATSSRSSSFCGQTTTSITCRLVLP